MSTIFSFLVISFWPSNLFQFFAHLLLISHLHLFISSFYVGCSFIWSFLLDHLLVHVLLSNLCTFLFYMLSLLFFNLQHVFCMLTFFIFVIDSHVLPTNVHVTFFTYFHLLDFFFMLFVHLHLCSTFLFLFFSICYVLFLKFSYQFVSIWCSLKIKPLKFTLLVYFI
jgi:hypothetical protein